MTIILDDIPDSISSWNNSLIKGERLKNDFELLSYILSHDFKKPLRVLINNSNELIEKTLKENDELKDLAKEIVTSSNEMQEIVNILLEYVRLEIFPINYKLVNCNEILENSISKLRKENNIGNSIINYTSLPEVIGHQKQLEIVFYQLISNAVKYIRSDDNSVINIDYKEYDGLVEFIITDNGIGIEEEYFEMIFILFQRLHTKEEYPGYGAGLAFVKKIIEAHGGKIWVESELNSGTSFHFTLCAK